MNPVRRNPSAQMSKMMKMFPQIGVIEDNSVHSIIKVRKNDPNKSELILKLAKPIKDENSISNGLLKELIVINEIKFKHIIRPNYIDFDDTGVFFTYEYGDYDLKRLIFACQKKGKPIPEEIVKSVLFQVLLALEHLHLRGITHGNISPANMILMPLNSSSPGILKLIGFSNSKLVESFEGKSHWNTIKSQYMAPEILLSYTQCNSSIDIWAAGILFYELLTMDSFAFDDSNQKLMKFVIDCVGSVSENDKPSFDNNERAFYQSVLSYNTKGKINSLQIESKAIELLKRMLAYDPTKRISATDALRNQYFNEKPIPSINILGLVKKLIHDI